MQQAARDKVAAANGNCPLVCVGTVCSECNEGHSVIISKTMAAVNDNCGTLCASVCVFVCELDRRGYQLACEALKKLPFEIRFQVRCLKKMQNNRAFLPLVALAIFPPLSLLVNRVLCT